ncbi:MAG: DUF4184 domain-containing protein [Actinomycetota bacterium]
MPFTPFHFGPGALVKSATPSRFSFTAFVATQVVIDLEPLYFLVINEPPVHRFFHSILGSLIAAAFVASAMLVAARIFLALWPGLPRALVQEFAPKPILWGAAIGGLSHVFLDYLMHPDIRPFYPASIGDGLNGLVSVPLVYIACVVCGVFGIGVLWWRTGRAG